MRADEELEARVATAARHTQRTPIHRGRLVRHLRFGVTEHWDSACSTQDNRLTRLFSLTIRTVIGSQLVWEELSIALLSDWRNFIWSHFWWVLNFPFFVCDQALVAGIILFFF